MPWHPVPIPTRPTSDSRPPATIVDGRSIVVIRSDAAWYALEDRCSHAGCAFSEDGQIDDDGHLICDCHGSEFDVRTGAVRRGPARLPIETFAVRERDDGLEVLLP